jgi:hypothetical protein
MDGSDMDAHYRPTATQTQRQSVARAVAGRADRREHERMSAAPKPAASEPLPGGTVCPDCGYDLRGSTSARCSECGRPLDLVRTRETQIPWCHRQTRGWFRAYWQTVWLVVRYPKYLCAEMCRPVSYPDSQRFRWVTLLHGYLPLLVAHVLIVVFLKQHGARIDALAKNLMVGGQLALLVWLIALPGLASYFFQSRRLGLEQQNRAIALSYYAWAPLSVLPLCLPLLTVGLYTWAPRDVGFMAWHCAAAVVALYAALLCERRLLRMVQYLLHGGWLTTLLRVAILNVLGLILAGLIAGVVATFFWLAVVVYSLC